jgi:hypothetical protein
MLTAPSVQGRRSRSGGLLAHLEAGELSVISGTAFIVRGGLDRANQFIRRWVLSSVRVFQV